MLRELRVRNYAIIEELDLSFGTGLNVLTGETGAGKSIIIGALGIALGQRAYTEMVKSGADEATVEAYFEAMEHPVLTEMGIDSRDGIIVQRVVTSGGKTKAYVNGSMVSVQNLAALGRTLVDIHGQNEHQSLLSSDNQLAVLDHFGKLDKQRSGVSDKFFSYEALKKKVASLKDGARDAAQRLDLLKFQVNEIQAAALTEGEDQKLEEEKSVLANLGRLRELAESAYDELYGAEGSALDKLDRAKQALKEISSIDKEVGDALAVLEQALALVEDGSHTVRSHKDRYEADPARLESVEDRLALIDNLKRKYGGTVADILAYLEKARHELESMETSDEVIAEAEKELALKEAELTKAAAALSRKRSVIAGKLEGLIVKVLKDLALEKSEFRVELRETPLSATGGDEADFLFSANRGEALKPMNKVASGGELSRIMLAVKSVLRTADHIPTLIFDEVDAGIGGKTAHNVAGKLKETSAGHQVLCVTHLPQIASAADEHLYIEKYDKGQKTGVRISNLSGSEREEEVARMLGGSVTETSLKHARELLGRGGKRRARA